MRDRYANCDETCTTDCGACKGHGRPLDDPRERRVETADLWDSLRAGTSTVAEARRAGASWAFISHATQRTGDDIRKPRMSETLGAPVKVRLDWMDEGDYINGLEGDPNGWNGFVDVWLAFPALYALDKAAEDAGIGSIFEQSMDPFCAVNSWLDLVPPSGPTARGGNPDWRLFEVQPDGERTEYPFEDGEDGWRYYNMTGWCFERTWDHPGT